MSNLSDLFLTFAKIGGFTFGGGYAMLPLIEHECVEAKKWLTEDEMVNMTVIAESTPGPIAINCATFTGNKVAGIKGAALATLGVVTPSFVIILIISIFLKNFLEIEIVARALKGIRIAVAVLIMRAGVKLLRGTIKASKRKKNSAILYMCFLAVTLGALIAGLHIPTIYLIIISGVIGCFIFESREDSK